MGGSVREGIFIIRRQVNGKRYEVSTRCTLERAALRQLARFEADPANYVPSNEDQHEGVFLTTEQAKKFLIYCRDVKKNSAEWLYQQRRYIGFWADKLEGKDLRKLNLKTDIEDRLVGLGARAHRIATIKAFYAWLRKVERSITLAEDPTFATLMVPQSQPGQRTILDKAIPKEDYLKARDHLFGHWKAALDVQLGTGWHNTEVKRFAEGGAVEPHPSGNVEGVAGVLVCPQAKGGGELRTSVGPDVLRSAQVLLSRGSFSIGKYREAVKSACSAAGVESVFTPGRFRATVATAAINSGNDKAAVSAFLNHKDPRTLKKFYATHAVVPKITTPL